MKIWPFANKRADLTERAKDPTAYLQGSVFGRQLAASTLTTNKGFVIYAEMLKDPVVMSCMRTKRLGVCSQGVEITAADDPRGDEIADFVRFCFSDMAGTVEAAVYKVLDAMARGVSVCELVWKPIDQRPYEGMIGLAAVKAKDPQYFRVRQDDYGNVTELVQTGIAGDTPLPPDKFIVYSYNPEYENPSGTSDLTAAYRSWLCKKVIVSALGIYLEKYGSPTAKAAYKRGLPKDDQDNLLSIISRISQETAIVVPDDVVVELLEVANKGEAGFIAALEWHNKEIAKAILGESLTADDGSSGRSGLASGALGAVHLDVMKMQLKAVQRDIEDEVLGEQIIRRLVDYNYPDATGAYPTASLGSIDDKNLTALADVVTKLLQAGVMHPEEPWIREQFDIPEMPPEIAAKLEAEEAAKEEQKQAQLEALRQGQPTADSQGQQVEGGGAAPAAPFHTCEHHEVEFARYEQGEKPSDKRVSRAINEFKADIDEELFKLRKATWRIFGLPEVTPETADMAASDPFAYTGDQLKTFNAAVDMFLTAMAGPERTAEGFASDAVADGLIQGWDRFAWSLGAKRASEMVGQDAAILNPTRNSAAITDLMDNAFNRLSENGQMRLEGQLGELQTMLQVGMDNGDNPLVVARDMSERFDTYSRYEFERLARTEIAFAQNRGLLDEFRQDKVDTSAVEDDAPPWHPNCMCSCTIERGPLGNWQAVYEISAQACELCQGYLMPTAS